MRQNLFSRKKKLPISPFKKRSVRQVTLFSERLLVSYSIVRNGYTYIYRERDLSYIVPFVFMFLSGWQDLWKVFSFYFMPSGKSDRCQYSFEYTFLLTENPFEINRSYLNQICDLHKIVRNFVKYNQAPPRGKFLAISSHEVLKQ